MKAKDVMTRSVVSVVPSATVLQAVRLMLQKQIGGLPVMDTSGRLVGIVTEGDFLRRVETGTQRRRPRWIEFLLGPGHLADEYTHTHGRKVEEVMTTEPLSVTEDTPLEEVVKTMEERQIKRVPVVRGQEVVGIVSRANLFHALASLAGEAKPAALSDTTIRELILAELDKQIWAPLGSLDIVVRNGIVDLWGTILDEKERNALVVAAENVPGVKDVRDHLASIDAMSGMAFEAQNDAANQTKAS